jgi:LmbE family N-acetylglucosaminyl deacetylase
MLSLGLLAALALERPPRVLCLGAHADDIEIGCGGTVRRLAASLPGLALRWVVFSGDEQRAAEARASAADFLAGIAAQRVELHGFRDGFLPTQHAAVKEAFERLKAEFAPSLVLTHHLGDAHQDHRLIAELTHNTFRDHLVLEYEIPKHDGDFGNPNVFVELSEAEARWKAAALCRHFASQRRRGWFSEDVFLALMRLRGAFAPVPSGYAEGFYCRKVIVG